MEKDEGTTDLLIHYGKLAGVLLLVGGFLFGIFRYFQLSNEVSVLAVLIIFIIAVLIIHDSQIRKLKPKV